jgi:hypothetical protein
LRREEVLLDIQYCHISLEHCRYRSVEEPEMQRWHRSHFEAQAEKGPGLHFFQEADD